jgi:hypothetical protein
MRRFMRPTITVIRAIGAEFARRVVRPVAIFGSAVAIVLLIIGAWLITLSPWWWILEILILVLFLVFGLLVIIVKIIVGRIEPARTPQQRLAVVAFVDKLERVAENLKTPQIVIVFYVLRDVVRPRPDGFIQAVSQDSKALAPDFASLRKDFQ